MGAATGDRCGRARRGRDDRLGIRHGAHTPQDVLASTAFTTAEVVTGEVGSSIMLNTVAEWTPAPVGSNLAGGTVTTVNIDAGAEVTPGTTLYSVNLLPVVIGQGAIPSFRALSSGATGQDVAQLQHRPHPRAQRSWGTSTH